MGFNSALKGLIGNLQPNDPKEDPSTDGRMTSNRTSAK